MFRFLMRSLYWIGATSAAIQVTAKILTTVVFPSRSFELADDWLFVSSLMAAIFADVIRLPKNLSREFLEALAAMMFYAPMAISSLLIYRSRPKQHVPTVVLGGRRVNRDRFIAMLCIALMNVFLLYGYLRNPLAEFMLVRPIWIACMVLLSYMALNSLGFAFNYSKARPFLEEAVQKNKLAIVLLLPLPALMAVAGMHSIFWGPLAVLVLTLLSFCVTLWDPRRLLFIMSVCLLLTIFSIVATFIWPPLVVERTVLFPGLLDDVFEEAFDKAFKKFWPF